MTGGEMRKALPATDVAEARELLSPILALGVTERETMVTLVAAALFMRSRANGFKVRAADSLADEVAALIRLRQIDARSPAGDALLDYREPPQTERSERLAYLETETQRLKTLAADLHKNGGCAGYANLLAQMNHIGSQLIGSKTGHYSGDEVLAAAERLAKERAEILAAQSRAARTDNGVH